MMNRLFLFTLVCGIVLSHEYASADDPVITEIPPSLNYLFSKGYGINEYGAIAAKSYSSDNDDLAMIWDVAHGNTLLPSLGSDTESAGWGISDNGHVSGFSTTDGGMKHAVLWLPDRSVVDLGTLANSTSGVFGDESDGYEVSSDGKVVGLSDVPNSDGSFVPFHAFYYDSAMHDLGTLNTTGATYQYGYSIAYDINASYDIVGIAHDDSWTYLPYIYTEASGMTALDVDPVVGSAGNEWYAVTINNQGMIGGLVILDSSQSRPYYWIDSNAVPVAIDLPADYPNGEVYGINEQGQMVGIMWNDEGVDHAFLFDQSTGVTDLNDLLPAGSDWLLSFARDINNHGQISGTGSYQGQTRGFLLDSRGIHSDDDTIADNWEYAYFADLATCNQESDYDQDGHLDVDEYQYSVKGVVDQDGNVFDPTKINSELPPAETGEGFWTMILSVLQAAKR